VLSAAGFEGGGSGQTGNDPDELDVVRNADRGFADGLIVVPLRLTPALLDELSPARLPVAVIVSLPDRLHLDNVRAALVRRRRVQRWTTNPRPVGFRIAFVNDPDSRACATNRFAGYLPASARLRLDACAEMQVQADDFTSDAGRRRLGNGPARPGQPWHASSAPTAFTTTVATLKVLHRGAACVPDDVAVGDGRHRADRACTVAHQRRPAHAARHRGGAAVARTRWPNRRSRPVAMAPR
jgi:LacI family transcriptional regulator